jgi:hypothetical protein
MAYLSDIAVQSYTGVHISNQRDGGGLEGWALPTWLKLPTDGVLNTSTIKQQLELLDASSGAAPVRAGGKGCLPPKYKSWRLLQLIWT